MLGVHAQVTFILATNTNIISKIFYFKQSSPGSANCMFSSQTGHSVIPKHFCFDQVHFLCQWLSLKIIVSMIRNSVLDPQIISKNGKQQEQKKKDPKTQRLYFLDGNSLLTLIFGHIIEFTFSLFIVWHWIYNILICYSRYVLLYAKVMEFYNTANATASINQSCNHIKIYPELVWQDSSINNY